MKWILPFVILSFATAEEHSKYPLQHHHAVARELQQQTLEAYYSIGALLSTSTGSCRFPASMTYILQCSGDGTAVALDNAENLGQSKCRSINSKTLECTDESLSVVGSAANVVMKCTGATERDLQLTTTLLEGTVDCSEAFIASFSVSLTVDRVCVQFPEVPNFFSYNAAENPQCLHSELLSANDCQLSLLCSNSGGTPCTSQLLRPAMTHEFRDSTVPSHCLFTDGLVPMGRSIPSLVGAPGNAAEYEVQVTGTEAGTTSCSVDFPSTLSVFCGDQGLINLLPASRFLLDDGICHRIGTSRLSCALDPFTAPSQFGDKGIFANVLASCTGESLGALALSAEFEPGKMHCFFPDIDTFSFSTSILQRCTGVKTTPFGDYTNLLHQQCSPLTTSSYISIDTNGDNVDDTILENCQSLYGNCLMHSFCEPDRSQELGKSGTKMPAHLVDVDCLVVGGSIEEDVPSSSCVDNDTKRNLLLGIRIPEKKRNCVWLSKSSRKVKKWYCDNHKRARKHCLACGTVAVGGAAKEEDPTRLIDAYKVQRRACAWLAARNDSVEICAVSKDARKLCKRTCNRCG